MFSLTRGSPAIFAGPGPSTAYLSVYPTGSVGVIVDR
jgi:hypothetical protein